MPLPIAHPRGVWGTLVGVWMAWTGRARGAWARSLLAPADGEKVLEVGFGAGVDLRAIARAVGPRGFVGGVDGSPAMVSLAAWWNRAFVREGRVILQQGNATDLPYPDPVFHAAVTIDSAPFWPDLPRGLTELHRVLRPSGRVVVVVQPRDDHDADWWRERLVRGLVEAGFSEVNGLVGPNGAAGAFGRKPR